MALVDVYNAVQKAVAPAGDWPTHDFVAILALHFRDHLTAVETRDKLEVAVDRALSPGEIDGLQTLKATYDGKATALEKAEYLQDMIWTWHAVEMGNLTASEANAIIG